MEASHSLNEWVIDSTDSFKRLIHSINEVSDCIYKWLTESLTHSNGSKALNHSVKNTIVFCSDAQQGSVLRTLLNTSEIIWEMPDLLIVITGLWLIWFFKGICVLDYNIFGLSCLWLLRILVFPEKGRCIATRNHDQQCSNWLVARQLRNDIISLRKATWRKTWQISGPL